MAGVAVVVTNSQFLRRLPPAPLQKERAPMTRFKLAGRWMVVVALLAVLGMAPTARTAEPKAEDAKPAVKGEHSEHDAMFVACAKACSDCQRACDMCKTHCGHMLAEGKKEHKMTLASCQDCATCCAAASQIVASGGPYSATICIACADCCSKCVKECEKMPDDIHMKMCAEECRKCEKACTDMVKHAAK